MVCVYCGSDTKVTNSRLQKRPNQVCRRRRCTECGSVFSSLEGVEWSQAVRVQNRSHLQPFSRDKLYLSIYEACKHRKTPVDDATGLTRTVLTKLVPRIESATLTRNQLAQTTSEML